MSQARVSPVGPAHRRAQRLVERRELLVLQVQPQLGRQLLVVPLRGDQVGDHRQVRRGGPV
jgi:hypothetical protein